MIQTVYQPVHSAEALDRQYEQRLKSCIESLILSKLERTRCPNGCKEHRVKVSINGRWEEGEFEARVDKACCGAYMMLANEVLRCVAEERSPRRQQRFMAA
jgi:hypothetical protein